MTIAATKKPSAVESLRALAGKKSQSPVNQTLVAQLADPAISGAKRDKNVVRLGYDPGIAERAALAAELKEALVQAESEFKVVQSEMRDYGSGKRDLFNDAFKSNITTVCIPFTVEVPVDPNNATPGRETNYIQVVCSHKYSVKADIVQGHKSTIGMPLFDKLFTEETVKTLKPNAEELLRGVFAELGLDGDELENSILALFDIETSIAVTKDYESEIRRAPPEIQTLLAQAVTRAAPALKFQS